MAELIHIYEFQTRDSRGRDPRFYFRDVHQDFQRNATTFTVESGFPHTAFMHRSLVDERPDLRGLLVDIRELVERSLTHAVMVSYVQMDYRYVWDRAEARKQVYDRPEGDRRPHAISQDKVTYHRHGYYKFSFVTEADVSIFACAFGQYLSDVEPVDPTGAGGDESLVYEPGRGIFAVT